MNEIAITGDKQHAIRLLESSAVREFTNALYFAHRGLEQGGAYAIQRAERVLADPRWPALSKLLQDVGRIASANDIGRELGVLMTAFPAKGMELFAQLAAADIAEWRPTWLELTSAFRTLRLRRTSHFRLTIAEILDALDDARDHYRQQRYIDLAAAIERARKAHEAEVIVRAEREQRRLERQRLEEAARAEEGVDDEWF